MKRSIRRGMLAGSIAFIALAGAACGSSDDSTPAAGGTSAEAPAATAETSSGGGAATDPAADLAGPGCAGYTEQVPDGAGSVAGMARDPVAVATGNNPPLTTLVQAVSGKLNPKVDLVDTLKTDDALLAKILTHHVVPGQLSPDQVVGEQTTVEKAQSTSPVRATA